MKFTLQFDMDNAAFDDDFNKGFEVSKILRDVAKKALESNAEPDFSGIIRDTNGNTIGDYHVKLTADEQQGK